MPRVFSFRRSALFGIAVSAAIALAQPAAHADEADVPAILRGPALDWVRPEAWSLPTGAPPTGAPGEILLRDSQDRLTPTESDYYFHTVVRLLNTEGVRQNAEQSATFVPDYQKITWHLLKIQRGDKTIDLLPAAKFKRLQRELGLEAKIYDGQISAVAVLEDIRVGDVLEVAYTLHDANPLMRGHLSGRHYLGSSYPIRREVVTIRLPADLPRPAMYYWIPPETQGLPEAYFRLSKLRGAMREEAVAADRVYRWEAADIPAIQFDPGLPPQASPYYPVLRCSSYTSWSRVVDWAEPLFAQREPLPEELRILVAEWKRKRSNPEQQLRAAVDWAQGDIRYFAMAIGDHNLRPRPLREIWASRFGDCKDKTVLLVALLQELGFEAWPALVNSYKQDRVGDGGPDQHAFNHAIVAYKFNGLLSWIDPTLKQPAGIAGEWEVPPYRLGLILRPNESDLTPITGPHHRAPDTETRDTVTVDAATGDAELATEVVIRGLQADFYRQYLESAPAEETSKRWFNYIGRFYRKLQELTPPTVQDDPASNQVTVRARYRLPGFLQTESGRTGFFVYAYGLRALLDQPESRRRHWPYPLPFSRSVRHRIEVELPFALPLDQRPQVITQSGVVYRAEKSSAGKKFIAEHDLSFTRDLVPAAEMDAFCEAVDEILADFNSSAIKPATPTTEPPASVKVTTAK